MPKRNSPSYFAREWKKLAKESWPLSALSVSLANRLSTLRSRALEVLSPGDLHKLSPTIFMKPSGSRPRSTRKPRKSPREKSLLIGSIDGQPEVILELPTGNLYARD